MLEMRLPHGDDRMQLSVARNNNLSRRQHFVPEHLLKRWSGTDGNVLYFKKLPDGRIEKGRKPARSLGYKWDSWTYGLLTSRSGQRIEEDFFGPIDSFGESFTQEIISRGEIPSETRKRKDFLTYIVSLIFRNPRYQKKLSESARKATHGNPDFDIADDIVDGGREAVCQYLSANTLQNLVLESKFHATLGSMHARLLESHINFPFIVGDMPILYTPFNEENCFLFFPLSPDVAIIFSKERILKLNSREYSLDLNKRMVAQAHERVFVSTLRHRKLVEKHLGERARIVANA